LKAWNADAGDRFGGGIGLDDGELVIGAIFEEGQHTLNDPSHNSGLAFGAAYYYDVDGPDAYVLSRTQGANAPSYAASEPILGATWTATVDVASTGNAAAAVGFFVEPATIGPLFGDQWLLAGPVFPAGEVLGLAPAVGPVARFAVPIPDAAWLAGLVLHSQAYHFGGGAPIYLSNALELQLGRP
jgi:hypothetical protein